MEKEKDKFKTKLGWGVVVIFCYFIIICLSCFCYGGLHIASKFINDFSIATAKLLVSLIGGLMLFMIGDTIHDLGVEKRLLKLEAELCQKKKQKKK